MSHSKTRLEAKVACKEYGWKSGDLLASSEWKTPRRLIGDVHDNLVLALRVYRPDGRALQDTYLRSLPSDTHRIEDTISS